jgi:hypothetical protein
LWSFSSLSSISGQQPRKDARVGCAKRLKVYDTAGLRVRECQAAINTPHQFKRMLGADAAKPPLAGKSAQGAACKSCLTSDCSDFLIGAVIDHDHTAIGTILKT